MSERDLSSAPRAEESSVELFTFVEYSPRTYFEFQVDEPASAHRWKTIA